MQNDKMTMQMTPNQFPEVAFDKFSPEQIYAIRTAFQENPKFDINTDFISVTGNTIHFHSLDPNYDFLTDSQCTDIIHNTIAHFDLDPIEYRVRIISEKLDSHHVYYTLISINP